MEFWDIDISIYGMLSIYNLQFDFSSENMLYETTNDTLRTFLLDRVPEYIDNVPDHWLDEHVLSINIQVYVAMVFLVICIPGNLGHLLVFIAYARLDWKMSFFYNPYNIMVKFCLFLMRKFNASFQSTKTSYVLKSHANQPVICRFYLAR